jgi:hypothetical protein
MKEEIQRENEELKQGGESFQHIVNFVLQVCRALVIKERELTQQLESETKKRDDVSLNIIFFSY